MEMGGHGVNNTLPFIVIYTICLGCVPPPPYLNRACSLNQGHIDSLFQPFNPSSHIP